MESVGKKMKKVLIVSMLFLVLCACATRPAKESSFDDASPRVGKSAASSGKIDRTSKPKTEAAPAVESARNAGIVVDPQDLAVLERMQKAVESYVHRGEKKQFNSLCKDKRFDCYVNEKPFPAKKKKVSRTVPPYASGSKMGLQGEERIQLRYEFFP